MMLPLLLRAPQLPKMAPNARFWEGNEKGEELAPFDLRPGALLGASILQAPGFTYTSF